MNINRGGTDCALSPETRIQSLEHSPKQSILTINNIRDLSPPQVPDGIV